MMKTKKKKKKKKLIPFFPPFIISFAGSNDVPSESIQKLVFLITFNLHLVDSWDWKSQRASSYTARNSPVCLNDRFINQLNEKTAILVFNSKAFIHGEALVFIWSHRPSFVYHGSKCWFQLEKSLSQNWNVTAFRWHHSISRVMEPTQMNTIWNNIETRKK